jgi:hypothetical protein
MIKCQHTYCKSCLNHYISKSELAEFTCPACRSIFKRSDISINRLQANLIDSFRVKCIHKNCKWQDVYSQLTHHIKNTCEKLYYCNCNNIIDTEDKETHETSCPHIKVKCVCQVWVNQGEIEEHQQIECLESTICCEYGNYGCIWKGKRKEYSEDHQLSCKVKELYRRCEYYRNLSLSPETDQITNCYKKSDCFLITGLVGEFGNRKELTTKYVRSYLDLKFPLSLGSLEENKITLSAVESDGVFSIDPRRVKKNYCKIDMIHIEGVMVITLGNKKDRFFIFPTKKMRPTIEKIKGGRLKIDFPISSKEMIPSPVVYSRRGWTMYKDGAEYPFTIEPSSRHIKGFSLKHSLKTENDALHTSMLQFFNSPLWD